MSNFLEPINKTLEHALLYNKERVPVTCPVCHSDQSNWEVLDAIRHPIVDSHLCICKLCGFITYDPQLADIASFYAVNVVPQTMDHIMTKTNKLDYHRATILKYLKDNNIKVGSFLDYGCSDGYVMEEIEKLYPKAVLKGVEPNKGHANYGKFVTGLDITTSIDLDSITDKYDLVSLYHVLEHIQKPDVFIQKLKEKMSDTGLLYVALPVIYNLQAPTIQQLFKVDHINMFTEKTLDYFFNINGLEVLWRNDNMYGTTLILQKSVSVDQIESTKLYEETKERLDKVVKHYALKALMEKSFSTHLVAQKHGVDALKEWPYCLDTIQKVVSTMDPVDGEDFLEGLLKEYPLLEEVKCVLGMLLYKRTDYDKALEFFNDYLDNYKYNSLIVYHKALIKYQQGKYIEAVNCLNQVIKDNPTNSNAFNIRASILANM